MFQRPGVPSRAARGPAAGDDSEDGGQQCIRWTGPQPAVGGGAVAGYSEVSRVVDLVACQDGAIVAESSSSERPAVATARGRDGRHAPHQPHAVKAVSRFDVL